MDAATEQQLREILSRVFRVMEVRDGFWMRIDNSWPTVEELGPVVAAAFKKEVSRQTGSTVAASLLMDLVHKITRNGRETADGILADVLQEDELNALADQFIQWWRSLPREYEIHFPVPRISMAALPLVISPEVEIRLMPWPRDNVAGLLGILNRLTINALAEQADGRLAMPTLCIRIRGYTLGFASRDSAIKRALFTATTVLQLGCALGLFERGHSYGASICKDFTYFDLSSDEPEHRHEMQVPEVFKQTLRSTITPAAHFARQHGDPLIEGLLEPIRRVVARIHHAGLPKPEGNDQDIKHANQVAIAANWYHDAISGDRDANRVIRTAIAIETLYGKRDEDPTTTTLTNRMTFALAKNPVDREQMAKRFKKFYGMRSAVVHDGHLQLSDEQLELLQWAEALVTRALRNEASLLP
jgi:hypothetical protein